jgi:hypothetical protein
MAGSTGTGTSGFSPLPSTVQEDDWLRLAIAYEVNRQMYVAIAGYATRARGQLAGPHYSEEEDKSDRPRANPAFG